MPLQRAGYMLDGMCRRTGLGGLAFLIGLSADPSRAVLSLVRLQRRGDFGAGICPGEYFAVDWSPLLLFEHAGEGRQAQSGQGGLPVRIAA